MAALTYAAAPYRVRDDLAEAHARAWARLARPGTWLDGKSRVEVAAEARHAGGCALCKRQKAALSPFSIDGQHDSLGRLPASWVELIHRVVCDPGRLTHGWYKRMLAAGIAETEYVEIVSLVAHVTAIDTFTRGIGMPLHPLPAPEAGAASRYRPKEARQHEAWAPNIAWDEHGPNEADYFVGMPSNIRRALTLVPDEARGFFDVVSNQYLPGPAMRDFARNTARSPTPRSSF